MTAADGTCPPGTIGIADFDSASAGAQSSVVVAGGRKKSGKLPIVIDAAAFTTPGADSPSRCIATITASGPPGDADASNDTTQLVIDVTDVNDC